MDEIQEYKVTGLRYALGEDADSWEKKTELAEELVKPIEKGTPVKLIHETGNPCDADAVGVYMKWKEKLKRVGYISSNKSSDVRNLLGEDEIGDGEVLYGDGHVTFFIKLVGVKEAGGIKAVKERKLPPYPFKDAIMLETTERENALQIVMNDIKRQGNPTVGNVREIISLLKDFVDLVGVSLCTQDRTWLDNMESLSGELLNEYKTFGLTEQECDELGKLKKQMRDKSADLTRNEDGKFLVKVMEKELDEYRKLANKEKGFLKKYDSVYLKDTYKQNVLERLEELKSWLETTSWAELYNYKEKEAFAEKLKNGHLSRRELHEIYSILLLIEHLEEIVDTMPKDKPKEVETETVQEEEETDYTLLDICNNDESIYNYVLKQLEKCKWPKDLLAVFDLLNRKKLLSSSDKYNGNIISMMLEHAHNYRGKRSIDAVQNAFKK